MHYRISGDFLKPLLNFHTDSTLNGDGSHSEVYTKLTPHSKELPWKFVCKMHVKEETLLSLECKETERKRIKNIKYCSSQSLSFVWFIHHLSGRKVGEVSVFQNLRAACHMRGQYSGLVSVSGI